MKVAVAIIFDKKGRVLITQRAPHVSHGGFWEFPGGKLEQDETPLDALSREIEEEVGLVINDAFFLDEITYTYPHRQVTLSVFCVRNYSGEAVAREQQMDLCWVDPLSLHQFEFPEANQFLIDKILTAVCMPV